MKPCYRYVRATDKLPALGSTDGAGDAAIARVKLFTPDGRWTWFLTEYDEATRTAFGLVDGFDEELGYISLDEIESVRGRLGLKVERDLHFTPVPLATCRRHRAAA